MSRSNSIQAYQTIEASGLLGATRWKVYKHLWHYGPLSQNDLDAALDKSAHKRVSELVDAKVVVEVGSKVDPTTGMKVAIYDVTAHVPPGKYTPGRLAGKPSNAEIQLACRTIRNIYSMAGLPGLGPAVINTVEWLERKFK